MENSLLLAAELRPVLTRLVRKLRRLSPMNGMLSQTERAVLVLLEQGEFLAAELAAIEKITPQSMGQVLNHLDELGLVSKNISADDKRKVNISLSPIGEAVIQQVRTERDEWLGRAIAAACTAEEQKILKAAIAPLIKLVDF